MLKGRRTLGVVSATMAVVMLGMLAFAGSASATLVNEFTKFKFCPYKTPEVARCVYSVTEGGSVTLGKKTVPITNDVVLQGGYTEPAEEGAEIGFSKFFEATNKETLTPVGQPVPGGLVGLVPPEGAPLLVKAALKLALENGFTGVESTLELARPASEIRINEVHLAEGLGVALKLPVKVHLENPFLGGACYIGSSTEPIIWELVDGAVGSPEFLEEGRIIKINENVLEDKTWAAPKASGCGGALSLLVDPIIAAQLGSTEAGHNAASLENTIYGASSFAVNKNDEKNP